MYLESYRDLIVWQKSIELVKQIAESLLQEILKMLNVMVQKLQNGSNADYKP